VPHFRCSRPVWPRCCRFGLLGCSGIPPGLFLCFFMGGVPCLHWALSLEVVFPDSSAEFVLRPLVYGVEILALFLLLVRISTPPPPLATRYPPQRGLSIFGCIFEIRLLSLSHRLAPSCCNSFFDPACGSYLLRRSGPSSPGLTTDIPGPIRSSGPCRPQIFQVDAPSCSLPGFFPLRYFFMTIPLWRSDSFFALAVCSSFPSPPPLPLSFTSPPPSFFPELSVA